MTDNNKKYKLQKIKKAGAIIGILLIVATGGAVKIATNSKPTDNTTTTVISNDYINVEKNNELCLYDADENTITIDLNNYEYFNFSDILNNEDYKFDYDEYYGLDEALDLYNKTPTEKSTESDLLDSNGNLDKNKLIASIKSNNNELMSGKTNSLTTFYTETSESDMQKICSIITEIVNKELNDSEIEKVANTLTRLTMFNKTGSSSNAYINNDLTFVWNPNMTKMYGDMQKITGTNNSAEDVVESVITHEVMHLLQHENNDLNNKNGLEVGMCRMFNVPNETPLVPVDSLYYPWLLEAAAELSMSEYKNIAPATYAKKISYARSYNLSRFNELQTNEQSIEKIVYENSLEEAFNKLNLNDKEEQIEFLKFLYSVEITQSDPADFWKQYESYTGKMPTEEEKLDIRMAIRTNAVKYMSKYFYNNLANSIQEGKITDLDTVFYMTRLWEIDCYTHLEYTKESSLESSVDFILWHNKIQDKLFEAIGDSSNITLNEIKTLYDEYNLQTNINENINENCNLNNYNNYTQELISTIKSTYNTRNFARFDDMYTYIKNETTTTNQNEPQTSK